MRRCQRLPVAHSGDTARPRQEVIQKVCRKKGLKNVDFAGETSLFVDSDNPKRGQLALGGGFDRDGGRRGDDCRELCGEDGGERLSALVFLAAPLHFCRQHSDASVAGHQRNDHRAAGRRRLRRPCAPRTIDRRRRRRYSHRGGCSPSSRRPSARSREQAPERAPGAMARRSTR